MEYVEAMAVGAVSAVAIIGLLLICGGAMFK
jgi:hypothetical protein